MPNLTEQFDKIWGTTTPNQTKNPRAQEILDIAKNSQNNQTTPPKGNNDLSSYAGLASDLIGGNIPGAITKGIDKITGGNIQSSVDKIFPGLADLAKGGVSQYVKNFNDPNSQQSKNRANAMKPENLVLGFNAAPLSDSFTSGIGSASEDFGKVAKGAKEMVTNAPIVTPDANPLELTSKVTGATTPKAQLTDLGTIQSLNDSGYLEGVKDTPGLQKAVENKISDNLKAVTNALKNAPDANATITASDMAEHLKNTDSTTDYIKTALTHLKQQYTSSLQDNALADVNSVLEKYNTDGLTANDINELAKQYGSEFSNKSFTKTGLPKAGVNADTAETVRSNLKDISRSVMPDKATRMLDKETSSLIDTQSRLEKQAKSVSNAQSNTPASSLAGKAVKKLGEARDIAKQALIGNANALGAKGTVDVLKMEELLSKHLKLLGKLLLK